MRFSLTSLTIYDGCGDDIGVIRFDAPDGYCFAEKSDVAVAVTDILTRANDNCVAVVGIVYGRLNGYEIRGTVVIDYNGPRLASRCGCDCRNGKYDASHSSSP
jgi:hypothetical protein